MLSAEDTAGITFITDRQNNGMRCVDDPGAGYPRDPDMIDALKKSPKPLTLLPEKNQWPEKVVVYAVQSSIGHVMTP